MGVNMCINVFGKKLKSLRKNLGFTQAQLADRLGISASTVGMYEQGRREPDNTMLSKICYVLNTSTDNLLGLVREDTRREREVDDMIDEFTRLLKEQEGLMSGGQPISEEDRDKIVAAIRVAAAVIVSSNKGIQKK